MYLCCKNTMLLEDRCRALAFCRTKMVWRLNDVTDSLTQIFLLLLSHKYRSIMTRTVPFPYVAFVAVVAACFCITHNVVIVVDSFTCSSHRNNVDMHRYSTSLTPQYAVTNTNKNIYSDDDTSNDISSYNEMMTAMDRRTAVFKSLGLVGAAAVSTNAVLNPIEIATAAETTNTNANLDVVIVAGATGQTGRRILERLAAMEATKQVIGGVRNVVSATKTLGEASTVVRGAMIQNVAAVDTTTTTKVTLQQLDVVLDSVDQMANNMKGANSLIIATGFIPGNPLKMNQAAHAVDNVGTCHLIDAAKKAGITKIVMVSSILTNGRNWGQEKSPGFVVTNAFGNVLDEKLVAEQYLRNSGIDYTIVRPGGLKAKPPSGALTISAEDTLNSGEVSRDLVADVCVASLSDPKASNRVLEIIEDDGTPPKVFNGLNM
jgi:nucleoside-diphosphate-sugar epimerase